MKIRWTILSGAVFTLVGLVLFTLFKPYLAKKEEYEHNLTVFLINGPQDVSWTDRRFTATLVGKTLRLNIARLGTETDSTHLSHLELQLERDNEDDCGLNRRCSYYRNSQDGDHFVAIDTGSKKIIYIKQPTFYAFDLSLESKENGYQNEITAEGSKGGEIELKTFTCKGENKRCLQFEAADVSDVSGICVVLAGTSKGRLQEGECETYPFTGMPVHGKWCGPGYGGHTRNEPKPRDPVDTVCMEHDLCYNAKGSFSCGCDRDMLADLPRGMIHPDSDAAAIAAGEAAIAYFSISPCHCRKVRTYRCINRGRIRTCKRPTSYPGAVKSCPFGGE